MIMKKTLLSDVFLVNNEILDSQHMLILNCMSNVSEYLFAGIKGQDLFELVDRLDTYCKLHFMDEEKVMAEMNFVAMEDHKAQHALFIRHLEHFMGSSGGLNCRQNIAEINALKERYLEHIVTFGKEYSERWFRLHETAIETCH
jgi:hemerythrin